jgi:hypothetical protein
MEPVALAAALVNRTFSYEATFSDLNHRTRLFIQVAGDCEAAMAPINGAPGGLGGRNPRPGDSGGRRARHRAVNQRAVPPVSKVSKVIDPLSPSSDLQNAAMENGSLY